MPDSAIQQINSQDRGKPAVIMADSKRSLTHGELEDKSNQIANHLRSLGLTPGDHVAVLSENILELFPLLWAAQRLGLLYTPVNWHLTEAEALYVIDNCDARILAYSAGLSRIAHRAMAELPRLTGIVALDGDEPTLDSLTRNLPATPRSDDVEGHPMLYSSGTTGRPKGIVPDLPNAPFGTGLAIEGLMAGVFGVTADSVYLSTGPLYHAAPLAWSMGATRIGATLVVLESFDPELTLSAIEQFGVTHSQFVPTMFVRMLKLPRTTATRYDTSTLEYAIHSAAPCPPSVKEEMIAWFGPVLYEYYAGSEVNGMTMINTEDWLNHRGSVGRAVLGHVHICDPLGEELPAGEIGQVWFSGSRRFVYHKDPEKTDETFNEHGWSTLGDLGHLDEEGFLYLSDRRTDLIISGGVNIYPREIEDTLALHPKVDDIAVVGLPDDEYGQRVHAVIQAAPGTEPSDHLLQELSEYCRAELAAFKVPRSWSFGRVPRLPSGKVLRRVLLDQEL